jgi:glucose-6-phosphate isomerase
MSLKIEIDHVNEKQRKVQELPRQREPDFVKHEPDIEAIKEAVEDEHDYDSLVVIGNGGSITSFRAYLYAFFPEVDVDVRMVTTMDPDYLNRLSRELDPENTLVMPVSKSGDTTGVIESLLFFMDRDFPVFAVTSDNDGALRQIVEREDLNWMEHPDVGGRFSGATETALVPAAFAGMPVGEIRKGAEEMYEKLSPENQYNPALNVASAMYDAEQKGYENIFAGFYSTRMFGFKPLFVQLMHETVGKNGEGQFVAGDHGPEFQHHTNQRIFGGKQNVLPVFFRTENHEESEIIVPEELDDVQIRGRDLDGLNARTLQESLTAEYLGVKEALDEEDMPNITLTFTELSHEAAGKLVAFLQYVAVYSAWLRDVDPFNQPDVEKSKRLGFEHRFG